MNAEDSGYAPDPHAAEATHSLWRESVELPSFPALGEQQLQTDICIIGGGIAGLTTAYLLAKAGRDVLVLEMGEIGSGQTGRTTAHLSEAIDDRYFEIERMHGAEGARLAAESQIMAIDRIADIIAAEGIDCEFERLDGYLFLAPGDKPILLDRELDAAQRAGLADVEKRQELSLGGFAAGPALRFPAQAQFHPLKYLKGLAQAVTRMGGRIFTHTKVEKLSGGQPCLVQTATGQIEALELVVATNTPINSVVVMHTKQVPYRSYVLGYRIPRGSFAKGLYWDTADPYHYLRTYSPPEGHEDILIVGGQDHKVGQSKGEAHCFSVLRAWVAERFPQLAQPEWQWSGQVIEPVDGLPFAGRNPVGDGHIYLITGDSGMGMTNCTAGALIVRDLLIGQENPWAKLYDPTRKTFRAALEFFRQNANVAATLVGDHLSAGEVELVSQIMPGRGALIRQQGQKLAVYRDDEGQLHACSATCPHLGCIVHFNDAERTWDCPCHGSRFSTDGEVLNGPAHAPLKPAEIADDFHPGIAS